MARSVSIPRNALNVAYADASEIEDSDDFAYYLSELQYAAKQRYPSLRPCSVWLDREDRAVLENDQAYITVSEYCGLVAVCAVPKGESAKAAAWCEKADLNDLAGQFGPVLISKGRFSNGEQVFIRADLSSRENISSNGSRW